MMFSRMSLLVCLGVAACAAPRQLAPETPVVEVVPHEAERRVEVRVDGEPFTVYVYGEELKKPVLHPLRTASGREVTRGFPLEPRAGERADHPHQVGLWFNYGDVNGLDFWNNSTAVVGERASRMGTVLHRGIRRVESGRGEGALEVTTDWVSPAGRPLLREDTRFVFHAARGMRGVDRITTLTALEEPVRFADNKEGLLGLRVARGLEQPATRPAILVGADGRPAAAAVLDNDGVTGRYRSSEGLEGDDVWGSRARWTKLTGELQGEPVTIAILDHPGNAGFPTYWHARGYGLFAANPLGQKEFSEGREELDFRLEPGESVTFRHRVLLLPGHATPEQVEEHYRRFAR